MKRYLEPEEGGLRGGVERAPQLKGRREMAEQPADVGVIIERSLGQIKAEKEAIERQIKKLEKLVESPSDVGALKNLQKRADRLAAEYTEKIAALRGETDEATEPGLPYDDDINRIDVPGSEDSRRAEPPEQSAFQERVHKRVAAWKAKLKPVETSEPVETPTQKGQFQHLIDETKKAEREQSITPTAESDSETDSNNLDEKVRALAKEAERNQKKSNTKVFLTPEEQAAEKAEEREMVMQLLKEAELDLDIEKIRKLRQGQPRDAGDRLVALTMPPRQAERILHIIDVVTPIKEAEWLDKTLTADQTRLASPEQGLYGDAREELSPAEEERLLREEDRRRRDLRRISKMNITAVESVGYEALRAYTDYALEIEDAHLPDRAVLKAAVSLNHNQRKIALGLLESFRRYCAQQGSGGKPKMSLEKFVSENPALEDNEKLRAFFGLKKLPDAAGDRISRRAA